MLPLHTSPVRAHTRSPLRAGPSPAKGKARVLGQETPGVGPKQMFKDLMSRNGAGPSSKGLATQTPARRALGDKTNNASPGTLGGRGRDQDAVSPSKKSPSKQQASGSRLQASPAKSAKLASRSRSKRQVAASPAAADASYMTTATPAPAELGGRRLSRVPSFVTPAQNIGKAGAIKARLGEMMDRMQGSDVHGDMDEGQMEAEAGMTEEELYPEIEYMAPSDWAKNPPYEPPLELADIPTGAELGTMLSNFRPGGFCRPHEVTPELVLRGPSPDLSSSDGVLKGLQAQDVDKLREEERRELFGDGDEEVEPAPAKPSAPSTARPSRPVSAAGSARAASSRPASSASSVRPKPTAPSSRTPLARLALGGSAASRPLSRPQGKNSTVSGASSSASKPPTRPTAALRTMPPPSRPLATKASNGSASTLKAAAPKPKAREQPDKLDVWLKKKENDLASSLDLDGGVGLDIDEDIPGL